MSAAEEITRNDVPGCRCHEHPEVAKALGMESAGDERLRLAREQVARGEIIWDPLPEPEEDR